MLSLLPVTFFPAHDDNRMASEGNLAQARSNFIQWRPANLTFLLKSRFEWMNNYLDGKKAVYELGSGAGFSKFFIKNPNFKLTDVTKSSWVDEHVDALNLPWEANSVDALVCSHMIHHLANPKLFFEGAHRVLKQGGLIVISEINTSFVMRFLLWLMRHEGWSYDINVFDRSAVANDPRDPWSANCAIPELLFQNKDRFEKECPGFEVILNEITEFMIFPLSGGVIAKTKTINLPLFVLRSVSVIDRCLIAILPSVFGLGRRVVLQKVSGSTSRAS